MTLTKLAFTSSAVATYEKTVRGSLRQMGGGSPALYAFSHGTGARQCNKFWEDYAGSIAPANPVYIDLSSTLLLDDFGDTCLFTAVKYLRIQNTSADVAAIIRIGGGPAAFSGPLGATNTYDLHVGEVQWVDLTAAGWPVVNSSADSLKLDNPGGVAATYSISIAGNA